MALGNTLLAAVLTIFAGCIFFSTKHPSLGDGDNPELVFRSKLFVPAHPPGYPLLMLIGKGADLAVSGLYNVLPFLTPPSVFCVYNTVAVVFTALTVGILFLASRNLGLTAGASTATSFLFVFAPNVRNYANQFEVFSLNNLLMALLIWVATTFECAMSKEEDNKNSSKIYSERRRCVCLGAFVSGLAMSNQHTSILFILPLAVWVIIRWPRGAVSCTPLILLSIVAGLLPYAALPLSMEQSDPRWLFTAWGATDTWQGLVGHFLRSDYGTFALSPKPLEGSLWSNSYRNWQLYGKELRLQTLWILWLLAPLGLLWGVSAGTPPGGANATTTHNIDSNNDYAHKKDDDVNDGSKKKGGGDKTAKKPRSAPTKEADTRRVSASIWWALTAALAFYLLVLNTLSNLDPANPVNLEVQRRFWFQPLLVVVLLIGRALSGISHICRQTDSMFDLTDLTVGMLIALTQILFNWTDFSDAFVMEDFSRAIINSLPLGAILVAEGDAPFFGTSAVAYALGERLDLLIISSSFLMSPFFQRNYEKSTGMKLPGERYGYGPKPLFNNADLLNTWIHRDKKRVFFIASQFTHPDDQSHAEHFAVRNMGVVNEFIPMSLFEEIGEAAMSEPLANAVKDWDLKKGAMGSYVEELLYALPLELPNSFNGSHNVMPLETNGTAGDEGADLNLTQPAIMYDIHTWESEILRNFKSLMSVNVEQLLAFASHDDVRARDVALPQEVADIVAGNTSVASFLRRSKQQDRQPPPSSILFSTPMRYQMLVVARALLQNNRLVAAKVLLPAPTAPSVDDLLMFRVMQQLMRFHLCSENGHPPLALFDETASIASTVLEAAKTFGVEDTEYFSRRDVLDYMVWLKRRVTRHNPEC